MGKVILVVAAHADDEALGCAGTMMKHVEQGDKVHVLFMTDGTGARGDNTDEVAERRAMAQHAADYTGLASLTQFSFPDNRMDTVALLDIVQHIEAKITELQPECIYTHHIGDLNIDHQVTHKAVMTACRPQPNFCVREIYAFEVASSTEWNTPLVEPFIPSVFVDIGDYLERKLEVLSIYNEEMRDFPHTRSINALQYLAHVRGTSVGLEAAEAFMSIRRIV